MCIPGKEDFILMTEEDRKVQKRICIGVDSVVSLQPSANRTSFHSRGRML